MHSMYVWTCEPLSLSVCFITADLKVMELVRSHSTGDDDCAVNDNIVITVITTITTN